MAGTDPIHQFNIYKLFSLGTFGGGANGGGTEIAFTNSALFMVITVGLIAGYLIFSTSRRGLVPNRMQLISEMLYEFVASMVRSTAGNEGMRFFPFVFSIFMFVLVANTLGIFPYFFTITAHIVVTGALALLVMSVVIIYGVMHNGWRFLKLFVPAGVPAPILLIVIPIELVSFLSRPISLSVRLFANMLAGHITLKVFAGFIIMMSPLGVVGWLGAILPLSMTVALTGLELLVAVLQAYVFAVLTSMYLNDAIHPSH